MRIYVERPLKRRLGGEAGARVGAKLPLTKGLTDCVAHNLMSATFAGGDALTIGDVPDAIRDGANAAVVERWRTSDRVPGITNG